MQRIHWGAALALSLALAGCATSAPTYDVNAKETLGRIVSKSLVGARTQARADSPSADMLVGTIGLVGVAVADGLFQKKAQVAVYAYRIQTVDGRQATVTSVSFADEVGDCVKLLESPQPTYPRFMSASGCDK